MNQNYAPEQMTRPEELMSEFNIKKDTYYDDLKYLGIKPEKDSEGKPYLTNEQAEQFRALRSHVNNTGKREGFTNSSIVKVDDSNLVESSNNNSEEDIYVEAENPLDNLNVNQLLRKAAQLKARELATPELAIRAIADRMTEDDLPDDLKQKVFAVRIAVNPKWTPADLADSILSQYRSSRSGS